MIFKFKLDATPLDELNAYKNGKHINTSLYKKALSYLDNGFSYKLIVDSSREPIKVVKVLKGKKL